MQAPFKISKVNLTFRLAMALSLIAASTVSECIATTAQKIHQTVKIVDLVQARSFFPRLVFYSDKEQTIPTDYGAVVCAANSVAYLTKSKNSLAVFAFDAKKKSDIRISTSNGVI